MIRAVTLALLIVLPRAAHAGCPSYTRSSSANDKHCDVEASEGKNPDDPKWRTIFAKVAQGPRGWGADGPAVGDMTAGCASRRRVPAQFPCEVLRAISWKESNWRHFCAPTWPSDQKNKSSRTIISFDCGYGVSQVTSGMRSSESPKFNRQRVANDPLYNLATGAAILAAKWEATACVGDKDPTVLENWYLALWAYNGLSYSNNPANPIYDSARGVYDPNVGGAYPYQEKIFGILEHPPARLRAMQGRSFALAYPKLEEMGHRGDRALSQPECASPTDCSRKRAVNRTACRFNAPAEDAGSRDLDAATGADAAVSPADAAEGTAKPGCGCRLGGRPSPPGALLLVALAFLLRHRRGES